MVLFGLSGVFMTFQFRAHGRVRIAARRLVRAVAFATSAGALCASPLSMAAPLTLNEAQNRALQYSRQLAGKDQAAIAAREMAVAAGQLPDPVLKLGIDNLPVEGTDRFSLSRDFMTQRRISLMQELTRSDKRRLRAERYDREAEKSRAEKSAAVARIQREAALAWFERYYAEAMAKVIAEQASEAKLEIQAAQAAYRSGRGRQADIFTARSTLAAFDDRASEIDRRIRNAKVMLARWTGDSGETTLSGTPDIDRLVLDRARLGTQLAHHPEIAVLAKQEDIAATEVRLAQANKKADWTVELGYQQRGAAYSNMVSIGASVPLQWDRENRQDRELSSKLATVEQARAEREEALRAQVAETQVLLNEWDNNRERQARYEREFIPLAHERTLATVAAYRGGKSALAEVLAARRNEIDVRLQALQLESDTARLWVQLNFLFPHDAGAAVQLQMNMDSK
jgi:outer membrane protein TolC